MNNIRKYNTWLNGLSTEERIKIKFQKRSEHYNDEFYQKQKEKRDNYRNSKKYKEYYKKWANTNREKRNKQRADNKDVINERQSKRRKIKRYNQAWG